MAACRGEAAIANNCNTRVTVQKEGEDCAELTI
jgi:hypothetical protein